MSPVSHLRYQMEAPPFVTFVDYIAPTSHVGDAIYSSLDAAVRLVGRGLKAFRVKMREGRAFDTLTCLDDRTLDDIGLRRSQIGRLAHLVAENPGVDYHIWCR